MSERREDAPDTLETLLGEALAVAEGAAGVKVVRDLKARRRCLEKASQESDLVGVEDGA